MGGDFLRLPGLRAWVLDPLGLPVVDDLPASVEVSVQVQIPAPGLDLLTGQEVGRSVELEGYGVLIVKE